MQNKAKLTLADKNFLDRVSQSNIEYDSKPQIHHIVTLSRAYQSNVEELCSIVYWVLLRDRIKREDRMLTYDLINNYIYDAMPRIYSVVITTRYKGKNYDSELIRELKNYKSSSCCLKLCQIVYDCIFFTWICHRTPCACESEYYFNDCGGGNSHAPYRYINKHGEYCGGGDDDI